MLMYLNSVLIFTTWFANKLKTQQGNEDVERECIKKNGQTKSMNASVILLLQFDRLIKLKAEYVHFCS